MATELGADEEVDDVAVADGSPVSPPALPMPTPTTSAPATAHTAGRSCKGFLAGAGGSGAVANWPDGSYGGRVMRSSGIEGDGAGRTARTSGPALLGSGPPAAVIGTRPRRRDPPQGLRGCSVVSRGTPVTAVPDASAT
jgi:hypothetical protein